MTPSKSGQNSPVRTTDFGSEVEFRRFTTSIMPSEHQEMIHPQEGALCQNEQTNNMMPEKKMTQLKSTTTSLPRTEGKDATSTIKEAWSKVKQAEDNHIRGIIAFLPRIEEEKVKPTSEHPENWNQLQLQEKANSTILENIIKLACMDDTRDGFYARSQTQASCKRIGIKIT